MKKNLLFITVVLAMVFVLAGCTTRTVTEYVEVPVYIEPENEDKIETVITYSTSLEDDTDDAAIASETFYGTSLNDTRLVNPKFYEVLGGVIVYAEDNNGVVGYSQILAAALEKFPETSAVINIVRDTRTEEVYLNGAVISTRTIETAWSGTAIKITETALNVPVSQY